MDYDNFPAKRAEKRVAKRAAKRDAKLEGRVSHWMSSGGTHESQHHQPDHAKMGKINSRRAKQQIAKRQAKEKNKTIEAWLNTNAPPTSQELYVEIILCDIELDKISEESEESEVHQEMLDNWLKDLEGPLPGERKSTDNMDDCSW